MHMSQSGIMTIMIHEQTTTLLLHLGVTTFVSTLLFRDTAWKEQSAIYAYLWNERVLANGVQPLQSRTRKHTKPAMLYGMNRRDKIEH